MGPGLVWPHVSRWGGSQGGVEVVVSGQAVGVGQGYVQHAVDGGCQVGPVVELVQQCGPGPSGSEGLQLPQVGGPGGFVVEGPAWLRLPNLPLPLQVDTKKVWRLKPPQQELPVLHG